MTAFSRMTPRERFVTAVRNRKPDRVPACPCRSNMVPARRTGRPFWDVYLHNDPPLWRAYLETARHFGIDGRLIYGGVSFTSDARVETDTRVVEQRPDRLVTRSVHHTPDGELAETTIYQVADPPTTSERLIRNLRADLPALRHLFAPPSGSSREKADLMRREAGEDAAFCLTLNYPGFHAFTDLFDGGLEAALASFMEDPEPFEELRQLLHEFFVRRAEMMLDARPDVLYFSASGTLHLSTPAWVRQFCVPTIRQVTRMARQAGVPTMLHACGRSRELVKILVEETELDCINPLEPLPMGDCDLAEIKAAFGDRLALSGNIHTTEVMLLGSPADVDRACREAIEAAGAGGGYLLMTGDQCGRDTPDENLFAFVAAAEKYGRYG